MSIYSLLQQIELGLPLNQLYVDLNNDEQITNDNEQSIVDVKKSLEAMITMCAEKNVIYLMQLYILSLIHYILML